jgi:hypothetical protein
LGVHVRFWLVMFLILYALEHAALGTTSYRPSPTKVGGAYDDGSHPSSWAVLKGMPPCGACQGVWDHPRFDSVRTDHLPLRNLP